MHQVTVEQLIQASKAARISAVLGVAGLFLFIFETRLIEAMGYTQYQTMMMVLSFAGVGLLMLIYRTLQHYLNQRFGFDEADALIGVIIWLNIIVAVLGFVNSLLLNQPDLEDSGGHVGILLMLILVVALGATVYVFSNRIARLENNLWELMRPLYICLKASGICLMAVLIPGLGLILLPGAMIFGAAADLVFSKIFAHAAQDMEDNYPPEIPA